MKVVLLLSGGLDSAVLLYQLKAKGHEVVALSVGYGQRHRQELQAAGRVAGVADVRWLLAEVELPQVGALMDPGQALPDAPPDHPSQEVTIVPGRNLALLSLAAAWAQSMGAGGIAYAANYDDAAIYPDCTTSFAVAAKDFFAAFMQLRLLGNWIYTKAEIVEIGHELKVPFELTYSCYSGEVKHCGRCGACRARAAAFKAAKVNDPTEYEVQP